MALDQTPAVNKITEHFNQQGSASLREEGLSAPGNSKGNFQTFLNPASSTSEIIDPRSIPVEKEADIETSQTLGSDHVTTQQSGSSTDDQQKKKKQEQTEEVDEVSETKKEKTGGSSAQEKTESTGKSATGVTSTEEIQKGVQNALTHIDKAKKRLSQPGGRIKSSYQTVIRNHLGHIDENLKIALSRTGVEYTPAPEVKQDKSANPLVRALDGFTHSENQLNLLSDAITQLRNEQGSIHPADLLAIQLKVSYIQQQIEFLTNLLNKALESTKTIMNVQV